eukprot:3975623-Pyramimonas_sp.AAC.1
MRVQVAAAAKRAAGVKGGSLLTMADVLANLVKVSTALYTELTTWFDIKCFNMQDRPKASHIMSSTYALKRVFVKSEKDQMEQTIGLRLVLRGSCTPKFSTPQLSQERRGGRVRDYPRARQRAEALDQCFS